MYAGHFAAGMAIQAKRPELATWPILLGIGFLDIVDGILAMLGVDKITPNLASGPYLFFDLTFVDWDHSLLMALVLSAIWSVLFIRDKRLALIAGLSVFSHFILDWVVHNHDLALFPHSPLHVGLGLWEKWPIGSWLLEGVFTLALCTYVWRSHAKRGVSMFWPNTLIALLFFSLTPWFSPIKLAAMRPQPAAQQTYGFLVLTGFLIPGLLLVWLVNRAMRLASNH